jgi:hypothetical protein
VNFSPRNTRETTKVKRLETLLKMVFDCTQQGQGFNYTSLMNHRCTHDTISKDTYCYRCILQW